MPFSRQDRSSASVGRPRHGQPWSHSTASGFEADAGKTMMLAKTIKQTHSEPPEHRKLVGARRNRVGYIVVHESKSGYTRDRH